MIKKILQNPRTGMTLDCRSYESFKNARKQLSLSGIPYFINLRLLTITIK